MTLLERIAPKADVSRSRREQRESEKTRRDQVYFIAINPTGKCFHVDWLIWGSPFNKAADTMNGVLAWFLEGI